MPVSIVIGGQFGSEGKGKIALEIARRSDGPVTVVRVGGPNSGHTGYDRAGKKWALRQLPAGCIDRNVDVVFPAGSYIDIDVLLYEIDALKYPKRRIFISPNARIITREHRTWEQEAGIIGSLGSTGSGVGGAVMASVARGATNFPLVSVGAADFAPLHRLIRDCTTVLRDKLNRGERIVIEGTQGFGLSLLDGGYWPKATARTTTAAGALSEAGLSPLDVDDVTMVIRSYPIRVAGESGPLVDETSWNAIAERTEKKYDITEYTTVTNKRRRVGKFDPELVIRALAANHPTTLVMNHLDYVGAETDLQNSNSDLSRFIRDVENKINRRVDWYGFSPINLTTAQIHGRSNGLR
ncbi:adenylosuccinate synthetase [Mesorhizobium sp. WSM3626]|uniref:adenylosuccinate synthetase n=1 Tax=Mesorhizobium sp. WSM3626 TaxID=1040987 RepID=UPI0012EC3468|nr:adenylosuccinate synthetase [Mesorhizobium sp. WSM3626]